MLLFSSPQCPQCHRVRMVLAEKETQARYAYTDEPQHREDLAVINPEGTTPTFTDRGMMLTEPRIIMEYLDDRFPHPPLMPVDPVGKARARVWLLEIERRLYGQLDDLHSPGAKKSAAARETMRSFLIRVTAELKQRENKKFFTSDSFTLLDASLAPILWRLKSYKIEMPRSSGPLWKYAREVYSRSCFQRSLTEVERDLHLS